MIERLKQKLFERAINRFDSTNLEQINSRHFDEIGSVGIIFEASNPAACETVMKFRHDLIHREKEVQILGFFNQKQVLVAMPFNYFTLEHLNFALVPKGDIVRQFIAQQFDVLINLDHESCQPLNYIAAASNAMFKIGPASGNYKHYDLMIDMPKFELQAFIQEIRHTFNQIN